MLFAGAGKWGLVPLPGLPKGSQRASTSLVKTQDQQNDLDMKKLADK
jgi:hypothetical protein